MEQRSITGFTAIEWLNQQHGTFKCPTDIVKLMVNQLVYANLDLTLSIKNIPSPPLYGAFMVGDKRLRYESLVGIEQRIASKYYNIQDIEPKSFTLINALFITKHINYKVNLDSTLLLQDVDTNITESAVWRAVASIMLSESIDNIYYLKYMNRFYKLYFITIHDSSVISGPTGGTGSIGISGPTGSIGMIGHTGSIGPTGIVEVLGTIAIGQIGGANPYSGIPAQIPNFTSNTTIMNIAGPTGIPGGYNNNGPTGGPGNDKV